MSNLQNTARLPLRAPMPNKWKANTVTNDLLERKTRALEGSLNKLKLTMQRDQTKSTIETYHRVKETPQYPRDKPTVKPSTIKKMIKCGQCEKDEATMKCRECIEVYCANCFSQFHLRGALQRHHCILLPTSQTKKQSPNSDINLPESNDDFHRKSSINQSEELPNEKASRALFQQSFLQWRDDNINKSKRINQRHGLALPTNDRIEQSNKLPHIEFNSLKPTSDENVLLKNYRPGNKNNQDSFNQKSKKTNITKTDQPKPGVLIKIRHSISDNTDLNDPFINIEPLSDNLSTTQIADSEEKVSTNNDNNPEQNERPVTRVSIKSLSRPTSSSIKKDSISPRPDSITHFQEFLRSVLATKSTNELEAIIDSKLILSRPSSSTSEKLDQPSNEKPSQSESNNIDVQLTVIDQNTIAQFDSTVDDLLDKTKIELAHRLNSAKDQSSTHVSCMNSTTTTPRRNSPFSFSNPLYKTSRMNSSSSIDIGDGGFFTDVLPRPIIPSPLPPPPIFECSTSNEWKDALENQPTKQNQTIPNSIPLRKSSTKILSRASSKHSITREGINHRSKSQINNDSRPGSSLSSSSLPVSTISSKPDFNNSKNQSSATSSRKSSLSMTSTIENSSSSTSKISSSSATKTSSTLTSTTKTSSTPTSTSEKTSSSTSTTTPKPTIENSSNQPETIIPMITEDKKATTPKPTIENSSIQPETIIPIITEDKKITTPSDADECLQEPMNSSKENSSTDVHASESATDLIKPNLTTCLTREENITEDDIPDKKRIHHRRQTTTSDESSKFRKLEFSVGDGLQWQEASIDGPLYIKDPISISPKQSFNTTTPRLLSPSNPINTQIAEQFNKYDNDDGRSSLTYQNMNDEECFNQLHQELYSELDIRGSDEDAILNEHLLKILQGIQRPFNEKDCTKLRETEPIHQPSSDNELLIHE